MRELEFFSLEERRFWDDLTVSFQYSSRAYKKEGMGFLIGPVLTGQGSLVLK